MYISQKTTPLVTDIIETSRILRMLKFIQMVTHNYIVSNVDFSRVEK